jgi:hypothetical protein
MIKNALIAIAVTVVGIVLVQWAADGTYSYFGPIGVGCSLFYFLQMRSGNNKEIRVDDARRKASLETVVPPGQALLYIYREGIVGKAVGWNVSLDGTGLAQLQSPRFIQTTVGPGPHTLGASATTHNPGKTTFDAQDGEVIVFAMKSKAKNMLALTNNLSFVREQCTRSALQKLSKIPMVAVDPAPGKLTAA